MKLKFAGWMLVMSGVSGLILALFFFYITQMPLMWFFMLSIMTVIPLVTGFYVFKRKTWALWMGFIYFFIQTGWIKAESFSWKFEFASPISLFMSFKTVAGVERV